MSRGPGRCQRSIIAALDGTAAVQLHELLPEDATRSQRIALYRAARVLEDKGVIGVLPVWDVVRQQQVYVLHRPGYPITALTAGLEWMAYGYWIRPRPDR
jgi:hypothetical protein